MWHICDLQDVSQRIVRQIQARDTNEESAKLRMAKLKGQGKEGEEIYSLVECMRHFLLFPLGLFERS
jgi:hypothetical protein